MNTLNDGLTRRDFLKHATSATLAGASVAALGQEAQRAISTAGKSTVVLVRDVQVLDGDRKVQADVLSRMFDDALTTLTGEKDPVAACKRLVQPTDTVGIKTNVWQFLATPPELEAAIKRRVMDAGVPEDRIGIDDRGVLQNPIFQQATALINVRPMHTHHWAGVGSCLKNYIMFSDNPPSWHDDSCANLAGLWDLPIVKGKTRLNVLVMLTPLFHGKGPHHFQLKYTWEYKGLIVGTDPVAVDATGLRILEAKRKAFFETDEPFAIPPKHIRVAQDKFGLGIADPERINLIRLGWAEEILI
ncbi:MAG: DUF362 domain-containing protein [Candidatus Hydrogenedentes bacterium]|nr:DUF362 domain-containing protein [Candidatus Hydrogenedentota bacterium]